MTSLVKDSGFNVADESAGGLQVKPSLTGDLGELGQVMI